MRILLAEDDAALRDVVAHALVDAGHAVDAVGDADEALFVAEVDVFDLLILDVRLPGELDGLGVCRRVRANGGEMPILLLTGLDSAHDLVAGLDAGADDYVAKPFSMVELLARVRALLRRAPRSDAPTLTVDDLTLDPATRAAHRGDRRIPLTSKEFAVLDFLMRNAGRIVTEAELLDHAWDSATERYSNVVQSTVRRVRARLVAAGGDDPIATVRGSGYRLDA